MVAQARWGSLGRRSVPKERRSTWRTWRRRRLGDMIPRKRLAVRDAEAPHIQILNHIDAGNFPATHISAAAVERREPSGKRHVHNEVIQTKVRHPS